MKESAGDANSLFFATREGVSEFAYFCVVAFGKVHDEVVDGRFAGGFHDLLARRARLADCDVVGYGIMEQVGLLCHVAFHVAEMLCRNLSHVFAKRLSQKYNIPNYDLDDIQWDNSQNSYGVKMPVEKRNQMLNDILQQPEWIIDGVYYAWVQRSFEEADMIYVLNMPKYLYSFRIIKRFINRKIGLENGKKETLKSVYNLLKWTDTFQKTNMKDIIKILEPHKNKVVFIKKKAEMYRILAD